MSGFERRLVNNSVRQHCREEIVAIGATRGPVDVDLIPIQALISGANLDTQMTTSISECIQITGARCAQRAKYVEPAHQQVGCDSQFSDCPNCGRRNAVETACRRKRIDTFFTCASASMSTSDMIGRSGSEFGPAVGTSTRSVGLLDVRHRTHCSRVYNAMYIGWGERRRAFEAMLLGEDDG